MRWRERIKKLILDNVHKLFYCNNAVESWSTVIENMILSSIRVLFFKVDLCRTVVLANKPLCGLL